MDRENRDRIGPAALTGLAFLVLAIVAFVVGGEPPDPTSDKPQEVIDFYVDNEGRQVVSAILAGIAATLLVFFGGVIRKVLRDGEGPGGGILPAVAFAGTIIIATGLAIDATITIALIEAVEEVDPVAVQTLSVLYNNDFVPFAVGSQIFLIAAGLSIVRHGALPKWLGWIAIVLAVLAVTPIGFVAFIGMGFLVAVLSVILAMRDRRAEPGPTASA
ncbi:MAG: hypothetical protein H0V85_04095 [Thermoleophilaceae bacterium]|nr:hypothetical protein [Thermoleophilaceae bacterium]